MKIIHTSDWHPGYSLYNFSHVEELKEQIRPQRSGAGGQRAEPGK